MKIEKIPEKYQVVWILPYFEGKPQTMREDYDRIDKSVESIRELVKLSSGYIGKEVFGRGRQIAGNRSNEEGIFKGIVGGEVGTYFQVGSKAFVLGSMEVLAVKKENVFPKWSPFEMSSRLD